MKEILFATGNSRKITEATETLRPYGVVPKSVLIDIDEIQHGDPTEIVKAKARAAYEVVHSPVVVSDTSWDVPALGGFPGGYMKDVSNWFDAEDWVSLMSRHEDKTIYCNEHVAYFDGENLEHFLATYEGRFVDEPRGRVDDSESFEQTVILYGDKTMAEQLADGEIASAGEELEHWKKFGEWLVGKTTLLS